jgi:RHS repeat-associated protein
VMSDENGLYYLRARYYNPDIKRFINLDVLLGSIDEGQSLNRYAYVNGNPISYVDPFGTCVESGEAGHMAFDVGGMVPVGGMAFDAINAIWYAAEGDWTNFGWSGLASIPGVGYFSQGVKYGIKAVSRLDNASDLIKVAKSAGKQFKVDKIDLQKFAKGTGKVNADGLPINNKITGWTKHGAEQAIRRDAGRGVSNKAIVDAVNNPVQVVNQSGGTVKYIGQDATVVLNQNGKVVTTWANSSAGARGGS